MSPPMDTVRLPLILLLLTFACSCGSAQHNVLRSKIAQPAALEPVLKLVDSLRKTEPEVALERLEVALRENPPEDSATLLRVLRIKGRARRLLGDYVLAIEKWERVHDYATRHRDSTMLVEAARQLGSMNGYMGNYRVAQEYLYQVAEIQEAIGTQSERASAMNGLAIMLSDQDREEEAIEMYQKALALYEAVDDTLGRAAVNANLGLMYTDRGEYALAEKHLLEQGALNRAVGSDYGMGFHYEFMALLRQAQGRLEEALPLAEQSVTVRQSLPSHYNVAESRLTLAQILLDLGRYGEAIGYARLVLRYKDDHQSLTQEATAYEILSQAAEGQGDFADALDHYRQYKEVADSLYRRDHLREITRQNALFAKAEQDKRIAELGAEKTEQAARLQRRNLALVASLLGILVLAGVAGVVFALFRKISRQKESLEVLDGQKDALLREIHHRVKNNLQMVSSLLSLQSDYIDDDVALDALRMGQSRVRSMAIIHQKLYLRDQAITRVDAKEYLDQLIGELTATLNVRGLHLDLRKEVEHIEFDIDRMIPLGLIANEVITNSMKYAFTGREAGVLEVTLRKCGAEEAELVIADNGKGLEQELNEESRSFGSLLIQTFAEQLDGKLEVDGRDGTTVRLRFPL